MSHKIIDATKSVHVKLAFCASMFRIPRFLELLVEYEQFMFRKFTFYRISADRLWMFLQNQSNSSFLQVMGLGQ